MTTCSEDDNLVWGWSLSLISEQAGKDDEDETDCEDNTYYTKTHGKDNKDEKDNKNVFRFSAILSRPFYSKIRLFPGNFLIILRMYIRL